MADESPRFRLNQAIAKSGISSRRRADELIRAGRVSVNGRIVTDFSATVDPEADTIAVDGVPLEIKEFTCIAMYKPQGVVTTCSDEKGRPSVLDILPPHLRHLRPVGRLDMQSEGLLLFTNDGELAQKVAHPVHHLPKRYMVVVKGQLPDCDLKTMARGMLLEDGPTLPARTRLIRRDQYTTTFELTIKEGRNRQIRRMCAQLGYPVSRLVRLGIGGLQLGQMSPGDWRFLSSAERKELESAYPNVARADRSKT